MIERRQRRRRDLSSAGKIGKYVLEESLRTQPTRSLYRAYDPFLDRKVAIKVIQLFDPDREQVDYANEAFFSEARAIGQLQHQNIISVYDAGVGDYEGYIVMEFAAGESLLQKLNNEKTLSLKQALEISQQVCHALDYAHDKGVIHRDIKPSNIMIMPDNRVKVVDFGISILTTPNQNNSAELVGTPSYMAPELVDGAPASIETDLYSLAVLLYEIILGRVPYSGDDAHAVLFKVVNEQMQPIEEDIPQSIKQFLQQALSKDPKARIGSCAQFEEALNLLHDEIDKQHYNSILDTSQLKQMQIFEQCSADVLHELAACLIFEKVSAGEIIISEDMLDEYICLVQGKALLVRADKHIIVPAGKWLSENTLLKGASDFSCKALTSSLLLRVSKSNLLESSLATQAYFFRFALDRIFIPQEK